MAHLFKLTLLASIVSVLVAPSLRAEIATDFVVDKADGSNSSVSSVAKVSRVRDRPRPATTVKDWMAQVEAATVQVTNVKLERTDTGLDITLETAEGKPLQVDATKFRTQGNNLIADIPNAVLALPTAQAFSAENPTQEIATVQVTQVDANTIRVNVAGNGALPKQEVTLRTGAFAYSLNPEAEEPDEEIVVTGTRDGYRVPNASTATKTDTPLRDIPQSIQVVPQQVLQDQQVTTNLTEALRNVPGVVQGGNSSSRGVAQIPTIRGFNSSNSILKDGLLDLTISSLGFDAAGIERIEVLKGPASVLYGQGSLGGVINLVTKKPLRDPYYSAELSAGSYNFYRGAIDLSGPLNDSKTVLYRLNTAAQTTESFVDFFDGQQYFVAPSLTWLLSDRTKLNLQAEYINRPKAFGQQGIPAVGSVLPNPNGEIPRNRNTSEPFSTDNSHSFRIGYDLEHRFSENWQLRNTFAATWYHEDREYVFGYRLDDNNSTVERLYNKAKVNFNVFNVDTYVIGKFATGSIQHQLVTGFNYTRYDNDSTDRGRQAEPLDLFNPVYGRPLGASRGPTSFGNLGTNAYGFYVQDKITLVENLNLLLGGRFDIENEKLNSISGSSIASSSAQYEVFSPRVGIVYQPIPAISLYTSYSRAFVPNQSVFGATLDEPERGTQYEVGVKADLSDRLTATLAFYDLTRTNVSTDDPNRPGFSIQVGEQQSRGIEFDLSGEILPGWNIIAGYALTDAKVSKDNTFAVGNRINNVPDHSFNVWTSYEIQQGSARGFGVGVGFFFVGDRQGDLDNTFELPNYFRTDAAIFYKRDRFRAAINFNNLFNVDYFESALNRVNVYPGEPFVVQGTVSWQF